MDEGEREEWGGPPYISRRAGMIARGFGSSDVHDGLILSLEVVGACLLGRSRSGIGKAPSLPGFVCCQERAITSYFTNIEPTLLSQKRLTFPRGTGSHPTQTPPLCLTIVEFPPPIR